MKKNPAPPETPPVTDSPAPETSPDPVEQPSAPPSDSAEPTGQVVLLRAPESIERIHSQLPELRDQIANEHRTVLAATTTAVIHAVEAGRLLQEAKSSLSSGHFHRWVAEIFQAGDSKISVRTAQRYMRLSENYSILRERLKLTADATRASHASDSELLKGVSVRKALRLISDLSQEGGATSSGKQKTHKPHPDELATPQAVVSAAVEFLGTISLDPCASLSHPDHIPAIARWYSDSDGLAPDRNWSGTVFVHPPQSRALDWVRRTIQEVQAGHAESALLLISAISDSPEFQELRSYPRAFLRERLPPLTQPSAVFYLGPPDRLRSFAKAFEGVADIFVTLNQAKLKG